METVWNVLNSPAAIALLATVVLLGLNRLYAKKPLWRQFEGTIISAVKWAEKTIPDDTANRGLARLDVALNYVIKIFESVNERRPDAPELAEIKEAIQVTHASLEAKERLKSDLKKTQDGLSSLKAMADAMSNDSEDKPPTEPT